MKAAISMVECVSHLPPCEDKKDECYVWKASGECQTKTTYMAEWCAKSCDLCATKPPTSAPSLGEGETYAPTREPTTETPTMKDGETAEPTTETPTMEDGETAEPTTTEPSEVPAAPTATP